MFGSRWAVSRLLYPSTTWRQRNGPPQRSDQRNAASRASCCRVCNSDLHRTACSTLDKANGIPASRCLAGHSVATGERTPCRCGANHRSLPKKERTTGTRVRTPNVFLMNWQRSSKSTKSVRCPPTKMLGITSTRNGSSPSMSIPATASSKTWKSESGWRGSSSKGWARFLAMCCP